MFYDKNLQFYFTKLFIFPILNCNFMSKYFRSFKKAMFDDKILQYYTKSYNFRVSGYKVDKRIHYYCSRFLQFYIYFILLLYFTLPY